MSLRRTRVERRSRIGVEPRSGAASVEHIGLVALVALLVLAAIAAVAAAPPNRSTRELGEVIGRRIACAPRHPIPCARNPLALAYGLPLGKLVRLLAPAGPELGGPPLPVDFRRCRRASCAAAGGREGLTASNGRVTAFTQVEDLRRSGGPVRVTYWLYRPGGGWERIVRSAGAAEIEAAAGDRLSIDDVPALVPLETLAGRDHYEFTPAEEPPWRWRVPDRYPG